MSDFVKILRAFGELSKPETTLPILDGGFDQQQLVVGVEYRFTPKRDDSDDYDRGY